MLHATPHAFAGIYDRRRYGPGGRPGGPGGPVTGSGKLRRRKARSRDHAGDDDDDDDLTEDDEYSGIGEDEDDEEEAAAAAGVSPPCMAPGCTTLYYRVLLPVAGDHDLSGF